MCSTHGVASTGGFCAGGGQNKNLCTSRGLADQLSLLFENSSVLDVGCGRGGYGRHFAAHARSVAWVGIDGAEGVEEATGGFVRYVDLSNTHFPSWLAHRKLFTWAMSLEVAEHLPRSAEPTFVHHLLTKAERGVVLSWAAPLQGGHWHLNCQAEQYVSCAMRLLGWAPAVGLTKRLRHAISRGPTPRCPWLKDNVGAYVPDPNGGSRVPAEFTRAWADRYLRDTNERCDPTPEHGCDWKAPMVAGLAEGYCVSTHPSGRPPGVCGPTSGSSKVGAGSWRLDATVGEAERERPTARHGAVAARKVSMREALEACSRMCRACGPTRCNYVSFSARHNDCSCAARPRTSEPAHLLPVAHPRVSPVPCVRRRWYTSCDLDNLRTDVQGFMTASVSHDSEHTRRQSLPPATVTARVQMHRPLVGALSHVATRRSRAGA